MTLSGLVMFTSYCFNLNITQSLYGKKRLDARAAVVHVSPPMPSMIWCLYIICKVLQCLIYCMQL